MFSRLVILTQYYTLMPSGRYYVSTNWFMRFSFRSAGEMCAASTFGDGEIQIQHISKCGGYITSLSQVRGRKGFSAVKCLASVFFSLCVCVCVCVFLRSSRPRRRQWLNWLRTLWAVAIMDLFMLEKILRYNCFFTCQWR